MGLLLLSCAVPLTGCVHRQVKPELRATIPDAMLDAARTPAVPGPGATQRTVAVYVTELKHSESVCRQKLDDIKVFQQGLSPSASKRRPAS